MNKVDEVIQGMIQGGAVLTLMPQQVKVLIAPQSVVASEAGMLVFHDLAVDDQHGTHTLHFDRAEVLHAAGVKFYQDGRWVAYLAPVSEEDTELQVAWRWWRRSVKEGEIQEEWYADQIRSRLYQKEDGNVDLQ
jgi:hypothetical protein